MTIKLRNPLFEAFLKYMMPTSDLTYKHWTTRCEWRSGDGFTGSLWSGHIDALTNTWMARDYLRSSMSFAVPNDKAIYAIAELRMPIVEIGAGTGYWAWILQQVGITVSAFDAHPDEENEFVDNDPWVTVAHGDENTLNSSAWDNHALLLCWPPYADSMADRCLKNFRGQVFIFIGETHGGCTGDEKFFEELEANWDEERVIDIPQWEGLNDYLTIYRRRKS